LGALGPRGFGFVLSVVSVMQLFSSEGKVFWLFPTPHKQFVVGPFLNRDHYACFIELVLTMARLLAAGTGPRRRCRICAGTPFRESADPVRRWSTIEAEICIASREDMAVHRVN